MELAGVGLTDFASGRSHSSILLELLDNFTDLADTLTTEAQRDLMQDAKHICVHFLEDNSYGLPFTHLETGSDAENVRAVDNSCLHMRGMSMNLKHVFAAEQDIMVIADIKHLAPDGYLIRTVSENPCFINILLDANTTGNKGLCTAEVTDSGCRVQGSYVSSSSYFALVNRIFFEHTVSVAVACITRRCRVTEVSNHGPALMLRFKRVSTEPDNEEIFSPAEGIANDEALIDLVPAISLPEWPVAAREWAGRCRKWPPPALVDSIVSEGVLAVHKCADGGNPDIDWRLSFSKAEVTLISNRAFPCRQHAHRIFKYIVKHKIGPPGVLNSYHCKTILLWASERIAPELWTWERLGFCVLGRFSEMLSCSA